MKNQLFFLILVLSIVFGSCNNDDDQGELNGLTGRELTYQLTSGEDYIINGKITFQEKTDHSLKATITMTPTQEAVFHPAHIHVGPYATDAAMAVMLMPVIGETGKSTTESVIFVDGSIFTFEALQNFEGHVKIHGDDGPNKDLILAFTHIGSLAEN